MDKKRKKKTPHVMSIPQMQQSVLCITETSPLCLLLMVTKVGRAQLWNWEH